MQRANNKLSYMTAVQLSSATTIPTNQEHGAFKGKVQVNRHAIDVLV